MYFGYLGVVARDQTKADFVDRIANFAAQGRT